MKMIVAFSTTDGKKLIDAHFGDGEIFTIYEFDQNSHNFLKQIKNTSKEERFHGDPQKAKGIGGLLKPHNVQIVCGKQFGKNIVRMVKQFVPVLVKAKTTDEALEILKENYERISEEWNKGEARKHLAIR